MSTRTNRLLVTAAAAAAVSGCLFAQQAALDPQTELVERIAELRAEHGPTPAEVIEPLRALALRYEEAGDHTLAVVALEEARHVTRVHRGLSSVDEAVLLRQLIRSEEARGNRERVWALEADMVTIARQHLDDIRTVPVFRELADNRWEVLVEYLSGPIPREIYLGCYYAAGLPRYDNPRAERRPVADGSCRSGTRSGVVRLIRREILMYYADAIEVIVRNGDYASQELRDLERQAFRVGFHAPYPLLPSVGNALMEGGRLRPFMQGRCLTGTLDELLALELLGTCLEPVIHSDGVVIANVGSWISLARLVAYETRSGASASARANALVELADWLLLTVPVGRRRFGEGSEGAPEVYERAFLGLQQDDDLRASATQIFSPELPVTLPTSAPNPFASAATVESSRYIDVAFAVTDYGTGEQVEILATSKDATRAEQRDLISLIERTSFRPRMVEGELAAAAPVVLRYRLGP